jgi:hypothetical protein
MWAYLQLVIARSFDYFGSLDYIVAAAMGIVVAAHAECHGMAWLDCSEASSRFQLAICKDFGSIYK